MSKRVLFLPCWHFVHIFKCKNYEPVVSGIFDKLTESSSAAFRADRPHELWFLPDGTAKDVKMDEETCHGVEALADEPMDSVDIIFIVKIWMPNF